MNKADEIEKGAVPDNTNVETGMTTPPSSRNKNRGRKRKRHDSESSTDQEDILPENLLEVEKNLQASAMKNNLDDASVKKILKKVVTNDHVLALVKLREEEEDSSAEERNLRPKLTRAKAKELKGISPKSAPWNIELTPIKHIPVKTRPEVKALIAQELPEDEDDDEYEPTHDDVPSDDDQTLESCSDLDSQPRTPATPKSVTDSPKVLNDGPFKVPQAKTPVRRKLNIEEAEATIALRTRSKLSLSATPIEHIESSFVPPDELPTPAVDEVWNQFLEELMIPEVSRNEDDDEADPEYNVAADPDAHDEDEEILEGGLIKISKKELSDLVTELFSIMPEATTQVDLAESLATNVLSDSSVHEISGRWEGKQEPVSDEEQQTNTELDNTAQQKRDSKIRFSIGKSEPDDPDYHDTSVASQSGVTGPVNTTVNLTVEERDVSVQPGVSKQQPPPILRSLTADKDAESTLQVRIEDTVTVLPAQLLILQQQLRQHIQLAASNFLQLYVNPVHWSMAPSYKEYLTQLDKMSADNPRSVVNVCNLKPAVELVRSWENSVSADTPENKEMVEFIHKETERGRRRFRQNSLYVGRFPPMLQQVMSSSSVFLYPYLLPAMPYRADHRGKFSYRHSEDELIALGLDQFWQYIEDNPDLFKRSKTALQRSRWGLVATCNLICKYMFPWIMPKGLQSHIQRVKKQSGNPIAKFFSNREIKPVEHKLLPYNPSLTLYEQPVHEMPRIWVQYLAKTSKRFRDYFYRRTESGRVPEGAIPISVTDSANLTEPTKTPLPSDFTQTILCRRINSNAVTKDILDPNVIRNKAENEKQNMIPAVQLLALNQETEKPKPNLNSMMKLSSGILTIGPIMSTKTETDDDENYLSTTDKSENVVSEIQSSDMFKVVQTSLGAYLVPMKDQTTTVNSIIQPISSAVETIESSLPEGSRNSTVNNILDNLPQVKNHCQCCVLIKKICKERQTFITDFFKPKSNIEKPCDCNRKYPRVSKRLRLLVNNYKNKSWCERQKLESMMMALREDRLGRRSEREMNKTETEEEYSLEDIEFVTAYQMKLTIRATLIKDVYVKRAVNRLFTKFNPDNGNPMWLAGRLWHFFDTDLVDLYKEFMGFLTADQADRLGRFNDYFVVNCMGDLVKKVEVEVQNKEEKEAILSHLANMFSDRVSSPCDTCVGLLSHMMDKPKLAQYVFSLFPHVAGLNNRDRITENYNENSVNDRPQSNEETEELAVGNAQSDAMPQTSIMEEDLDIGTEDTGEGQLTICEETPMDYEADHSSSDKENEYTHERQPMKTTTEAPYHFKTVVSATNNEVDTPDLTITKTEIQDPSGSPTPMSEDENVKVEVTEVTDATETSEWKRDEDKLILEILLQHVTRLERKEVTILDILEEKNVYQTIANSLPHKSLNDVKDRVIYLLEILVLSEY